MALCIKLLSVLFIKLLSVNSSLDLKSGPILTDCDSATLVVWELNGQLAVDVSWEGGLDSLIHQDDTVASHYTLSQPYCLRSSTSST